MDIGGKVVENNLWEQHKKDRLNGLKESGDVGKIASVHYDLGMAVALGSVLYAILEDYSTVEIQSFVYKMIEDSGELAKDVHAMKNHLKDKNIRR